MSLKVDNSAMVAVQNYVLIHTLLSNSMDLFWPYCSEDNCHWYDNILESFDECRLVVDNETTEQFANYTLQEVADILSENFPEGFENTDKSPMGDTLAERACVDIYLSHNVSDVPDELRQAFDAGSDIYNSRKRVSQSC